LHNERRLASRQTQATSPNPGPLAWCNLHQAVLDFTIFHADWFAHIMTPQQALPGALLLPFRLAGFYIRVPHQPKEKLSLQPRQSSEHKTFPVQF
jgi:hypothetical protein